MRENLDYAFESLDGLKTLIRENPWATFISYVPGEGLVASHYPVLLDEGEYDDVVLFSHVGKPDEEKHHLGQYQMLCIIEGPHGYISPSWYGYRPNVPTWNFVVAHLHGAPEVLDHAENLAVLDRLVEHFEKELPEPYLLHSTVENSDYADRIVHGTVGFRMRVDRWEAKEKMNQDKPADSLRTIISELRGRGPYANPALADRVERVNAARLGLC